MNKRLFFGGDKLCCICRKSVAPSWERHLLSEVAPTLSLKTVLGSVFCAQNCRTMGVLHRPALWGSPHEVKRLPHRPPLPSTANDDETHSPSNPLTS